MDRVSETQLQVGENSDCIIWRLKVNPYPADLIHLNFQPLEFVSRYRDPQPQVVENYSYLLNLRPNIYKS